MDARHFGDQELVRRKKLEQLIEKNLNPYQVTRCQGLTPIKKVLELAEGETKESLSVKVMDFKCVGRVMLLREPFMVISEEHNTIQCYVNIKKLDPSIVEYFKDFVDIGDVLEVEGSLFFTQKEELTLRLSNLRIVSKCLKPLPEKHSGIKDKELLVRERVAALIVNKGIYQTYQLRSKLIFALRSYLHEKDYMEVETPTLQKIAGGALARPFITYYNSLAENFYLRIAPELDLKKLVTAGYHRVFEIGKSFRNEGIDATHNPEFTSIEVYTAYYGMEDTMDLTENIFKYLASYLGISQVNWEGAVIDLTSQFKRYRITDLVKEKVGIDFYNEDVSLEKALLLAEQYSIELLEHEKTVGHILHKLFEELIEHTLVQPTFIYGYHIDVSPLAKQDIANLAFTDRFEFYIGRKEFANGFAELNNPIEQLRRFQEQQNERSKGNDEIGAIDMNYIENIEYGLPPTGGLGIGIDRMVMLFTEKSTIKDVVFFPHLKNK